MKITEKQKKEINKIGFKYAFTRKILKEISRLIETKTSIVKIELTDSEENTLLCLSKKITSYHPRAVTLIARKNLSFLASKIAKL